jgi:glucosamine 6-phosphate synthetase-like amidotransferase/phosphosugar isomerase protein
MCAIYGSNDQEKLYKLYKANQNRGNYSTGLAFLKDNDIVIHKGLSEGFIFKIFEEATYYIGHNRAPTTNEQGRNFSGIHPFIFGKALAAHNGILTNIEHLEQTWNIKFATDSEWIPFLYQQYSQSDYNSEEVFLKVLQNIEGTFGIWLYDTDKKDLLVARGDNSIYWNEDKTCFSSVECDDINQLMPEGSIYKSNLGNSFIKLDLHLKRKQKYFIL